MLRDFLRNLPIRPFATKVALCGVLAIASLAVVLAAVPVPSASAVSTVPTKINFQGRLTTAAGAPVADGLYNMKFALYDAVSGGTLKWSETRETTNRVQVTGGLFSTKLGDVTALDPTIFANGITTPLYFEITLANPATATCSTAGCQTWESAMNRNQVATSAYAFNSDLLDGLDSSAFAASTGSANYIQNQNSAQQTTSNFWMSGTGRADTALQAPLVDTATATTLNIGTTNATSISLNKDVTVAAGKSLTLVGGNTASRPASPTEGMVYYDTDTKQLLTYSNGKWQADSKAATAIVAAGNSSQAAKDSAQFVGNGTADDVAINAAITALPGSGGKVFLLEGTYNLTAAVQFNKGNSTLAGTGKSTILRRQNNSGGADGVINVSGDSSRVTELMIDGNKAAYTSTNNVGIFINGNNNQEIDHTWLANSAGHNFLSGAYVAENSKIHDNEIYGSGQRGISVDNPNYTVFDNNKIYSNGGEGININNSSTTIIINNNVYDNGAAGIRAHGSKRVNNNRVVNNAGTGIYGGDEIMDNLVTGNGDTGVFFRDGAQVKNNIITSNTGEGAFYDTGVAATTPDAIFSNNSVTSNTANGLKLWNCASKVLVEGNNFHNNGGTGGDNGIYINAYGCGGAVGITVQNNTITDTAGTGYAIQILGARNTYLSGNVYSGTGASSISDAGTGTIWSNQLDANGNLINNGVGAMTIGTSTISATMSLQGGLNTVTLSTPSAPTITQAGVAGSTSYSYTVTAVDGTGETVASTAGTIATGNATLNGTNYTIITWSKVSGAISYNVYRTASGGTPSSTGKITATAVVATSGATQSFNDTGIAASGSSPASNSTGGGSFAGSLLTSNLDTATATTLSMGTTNATAINIGRTGSNITTTVNGTFIAKSAANSTTAFQVQNASSISMFTVDTTNARLYVGPTAGDTTGAVLVLGNKTNAGDPTGVEGGMYYNSSTKDFRCYSNGVWRNCDGNGDDTVELKDDFMSGYGGPGLWDKGGELQWWCDVTGAFAGSCNANPGTEETNHPGIMEINTQDAVSGHAGLMQLRAIDPSVIDRMTFIVKTTAITNLTLRVGLVEGGIGSEIAPASGAFFYFNPSSSANWQYQTRNASAGNPVATTVAAAANTWYRFEIVHNSSGNWDFYINGTQVGTNISTNKPTGFVMPAVQILNNTATQHSILVDYFTMRSKALTR